MNSEAPRPSSPLKSSKCFEGNGAFVVFTVTAFEPGKPAAKFHLVADARPSTFGVRAEAERTDDLKTGGAVVNLLRKHARTSGIGRIARDPERGSIWLPLFTAGAEPTFWVELARTSPPELRLVAADGTVLIRKSTQGSYTKRRPLEYPLPPFPLPETWETITPSLDAEPDEDVDQPERSAAAPLPEYQRLARDRLSRRHKTLRKALEKSVAQVPSQSDLAAFERQALFLQEHVALVKPGDWQLTVDGKAVELDPEQTPGANVTEFFTRSKKAKRARVALLAHVAKSQAELDDLAAGLARLRAGPEPLAVVQAMLKRHRLPETRQSHAPRAASGEVESKPYRVYDYRPPTQPDQKPIHIFVGKAAADNDELCKLAKSNDFWLHAIGVTGSHVIIPARQLKGAPDLALIRAAAVLALHFSKVRTDMKGEVYWTRRQHIKKRKGMAPGLWSVEQAETLFFRYDEAELQRLLDAAHA